MDWLRITGWALVVTLILLAVSDVASDSLKAPERTAHVIGRVALIAWILGALARL